MSSPPTTPQPALRRSPKRRAQTSPPPRAPRTREDILREKMPITPPASRFARYVSATSVDALDALAAVASTAPPSPAVTRRPFVPQTPKSASNAAIRWLSRITESRPETSEGWPADVKGSPALRRLIVDDERWQHTVHLVTQMSDRLASAMSDITAPERTKQAVAVFFASLENVLVKEEARLQGKPKWIIDNLVKATPVYKSLFVCSFDVMAAAYGNKDLSVFVKAMQVLQVPPLDIVKVMESFVRLSDMPRSLASHIITCGNRVLDSMAWKSDSKLVQDLKQRAIEKTTQIGRPVASSSQSNESQPNGTPSRSAASREADGDDEVPKNAVREFTLEFFYKKMLSVASERTQELLILLSMDAIAEPVWASLKYAVWERWHLMVDRHLDQIIMCCIYGVAKVRRYELKFREIIQAYQAMSHVREPCFAHLLPGVFRDVSLNPHTNLIPSDETLRNIRHSVTGTRGDIIKLYNQVFIHSMKSHILQFQVTSSIPPAGVMHGRSFAGQANSTADSNAHSSSAQHLSASNSVLSGTPVRGDNIDRDALNEKVMSSPMRMLRPHASPRRIGRVTVSPMSPGGRSLVAMRQSPGRRAAGNIIGSMTPGTRKLYAFGESPVKNLERINRSIVESEKKENRGEVRSSIPLSFEGNGIGQRKASMRRRMADALPFKSLRQGSVKFAASSEESEGERGGRSGVTRLEEGSAQTSVPSSAC